MFPPKEDKRICKKYDGHVVPIHECLLSLICFCLPLTDFEVGIFNIYNFSFTIAYDELDLRQSLLVLV